MKNPIFSAFFALYILVSIATNVSAQTSKHNVKSHPKAIAKAKVPKVVSEAFIMEYPVIESEMWYPYPSFGNRLDWYDYNPGYYFDEYPENYIVEYVKEQTPHKAVYTKAGKKIAEHHKIKSDVVPVAVSEAMKKGMYKDWKETAEKEEIIKVENKEKVYRMTFEKKGEKHHVFYDVDGKVLKDKKVGK